MEKSCATCSPCNKFTIWVALPLLVMMAILFIASSQNVFAEIGVNIPNEAAEPSCAESGSCFLPTDATVDVGDTVTWTNDSSVIHTITSGNPDGHDGTFDSSIIMAGEIFSYTFTEAGQYEYFCSIHPWMTGTIMVN